MAKKETKDPEPEAMRIIIGAIEKVPEERRLAVLQYVATKVGGGTLAEASAPHPSEGAPVITTAPGAGRLQPNERIDRFLQRKAPQDIYQNVACLAYFLTHDGNQPEFSTADLTTASQDARYRRIGNMAQAVKDTERRKHFLMAGRARGAKQLSTLGEQVVEALPDQQKVEQIIESWKPRRKRGRKKKGKK